MSAQTKSRTKWVVGALVATGAFAITFIVRQTPPPQIPNSSITTPTGQLVWLSPLALQSILRPPAVPTAITPMEGIEPAERHNLYEMQKYQRRVFRSPQSEPGTINQSLRDHVIENHR